MCVRHKRASRRANRQAGGQAGISAQASIIEREEALEASGARASERERTTEAEDHLGITGPSAKNRCDYPSQSSFPAGPGAVVSDQLGARREKEPHGLRNTGLPFCECNLHRRSATMPVETSDRDRSLLTIGKDRKRKIAKCATCSVALTLIKIRVAL